VENILGMLISENEVKCSKEALMKP